MLFLPNPLSNLFLQEGADMSELRQGLFPRDQVPHFHRPEKRAPCGPPKRALQNIGNLARFQGKQLGDLGITGRKLRARFGSGGSHASGLRRRAGCLSKPRFDFYFPPLRFCSLTNHSACFGPCRASGRNFLPRSWL